MPDLSEMMTKRRPMAHVWPLLIVGGLGVAVAVAAWIAVSVWEERLAKAKFNDVAGDYATVLQHGLDAYLDKILALRAFYDASNGVERREFNLFTSQILAGHGDAMRLVWCPRVNGDERDAFEHDVRDNGLSDYSIKTWAPDRTGLRFEAPPRVFSDPLFHRLACPDGDVRHGSRLGGGAKQRHPSCGRWRHDGDGPERRAAQSDRRKARRLSRLLAHLQVRAFLTTTS